MEEKGLTIYFALLGGRAFRAFGESIRVNSLDVALRVFVVVAHVRAGMSKREVDGCRFRNRFAER